MRQGGWAPQRRGDSDCNRIPQSDALRGTASASSLSQREPLAPLAHIAPGRADFILPRTPEAEAAFDLVVTGLRRIAATAPAAVAVEIISAVRVLTGDA